MARKRKNAEQKSCNMGEKFDKNGQPIQRNAANARERARMRVLSKAFSRLKTTLPWVPADTKLSKLDTLRLAACYIAYLSQILEDDKVEAPQSPDSTDSGNNVHPMNLTWPFSFNSRLANSLNGKSSEVLKLQTKAEITQS